MPKNVNVRALQRKKTDELFSPTCKLENRLPTQLPSLYKQEAQKRVEQTATRSFNSLLKTCVKPYISFPKTAAQAGKLYRRRVNKIRRHRRGAEQNGPAPLQPPRRNTGRKLAIRCRCLRARPHQGRPHSLASSGGPQQQHYCLCAFARARGE